MDGRTVADPVTLGAACLQVLTATDPRVKVMAARWTARNWRLYG
jgi:hypothetical protein